MLEQMTDEQLTAEHTRALQLADICNGQGFPQAATIHHMTARALSAELQARLSQA